MTKRILFISYFYYPYKAVGANRIRFWVENILKYHPEYEPIVLTATPFSEEERMVKNQFFIPADGFNILQFFIKDKGLNWAGPLKRFLQKQSLDHVQSVVITGGPFMHFGLAAFLKSLLKCKVALDFRDPFADNPRLHNSGIKIMIKKYFERSFVRMADIIISTNNKSLEQIALYREGSKYQIVRNGYDEDILKQAKTALMHNTPAVGFNIIYAGRYYDYASPSNTFEVITELNSEGKSLQFIHLGAEDSKYSHGYSFLTESGVVDYTEVMKKMVTADLGIIYVEGFEFENTTKVYDYIGAELPILIISSGYLNVGDLENLTMDYPEVIWCHNNKAEIKKALIGFLEKRPKVSYPEREKYSRRRSLESLLKILERQ